MPQSGLRMLDTGAVDELDLASVIPPQLCPRAPRAGMARLEVDGATAARTPGAHAGGGARVGTRLPGRSRVVARRRAARYCGGRDRDLTLAGGVQPGSGAGYGEPRPIDLVRRESSASVSVRRSLDQDQNERGDKDERGLHDQDLEQEHLLAPPAYRMSATASLRAPGGPRREPCRGVVFPHIDAAGCRPFR